MENGASSYRRFLEGDKNAFSELLDLYRDNLIFFINRTIHNLHVAEELAADCFVELLVHPKRYNFQYSLKTYLFTIAHHKTVNYIRQKKWLKKARHIFLSKRMFCEANNSKRYIGLWKRCVRTIAMCCTYCILKRFLMKRRLGLWGKIKNKSTI